MDDVSTVNAIDAFQISIAKNDDQTAFALWSQKCFQPKRATIWVEVGCARLLSLYLSIRWRMSATHTLTWNMAESFANNFVIEIVIDKRKNCATPSELESSYSITSSA
jgi:hypothetical protein